MLPPPSRIYLLDGSFEPVSGADARAITAIADFRRRAGV
jgi:hypothetical protein